MIRFVILDGKILDILVRVTLFKKSLTGNALARNIFDTITAKLVLKLEDVRVTMCDHASTNKSALNLLRQIHNVTIADFFCFSYTLNNTGKAMCDGKNATFISESRNMWQVVIQYPGKARGSAKEKFGCTVKKSGSARFYNKYEKIVHIVDHGCEKVLQEILPICK